MMALFPGERAFWLLTGGTLGAMAALNVDKTRKKIRAAAVETIKESYACKERLAARFAHLKGEAGDIADESIPGQDAYSDDAAGREEDILRRIEQMVEERLEQIRAESKEG